METISKHEGLAVPSYALSYLVNADDSGLENNDRDNIDTWYQQFLNEAKAAGGSVIFGVEGSGESYFTWSPEFGLACDVTDCTILICK